MARLVDQAWISLYELEPRGKLSELAANRPRPGALLKVRFHDELIGYADLFPWPELGDAPLSEQIAGLARDEATPLLVNSLAFARSDAEARAQGVSLWTGLGQGLEIPPSHFLVLDPETPDAAELERARASGFDHFKAKLPADPERAAQTATELSRALGPSCKLRFDFNSMLSADAYSAFTAALGSKNLNIDYIEDPTPWTVDKGFGVPEAPLTPAVDREASIALLDGGFCPPVIIIKPALQDWKYCVRRAKLCGIRPVFGSYLDHPVGQAFAAWAAAVSQPHEVCGLISHLAYAPNEFSERLSHQGPRLIAPQNGTGIGFDDLLEKRAWKKVS